MIRTILLLLLICASCQTSTYEDFREKGRAKTHRLISELKKIRTKDQLIVHEKELKLCFVELSELLQAANTYAQAHPEEEPNPLLPIDLAQSEELRKELLRLSRIDGGREIIERCRLIVNY